MFNMVLQNTTTSFNSNFNMLLQELLQQKLKDVDRTLNPAGGQYQQQERQSIIALQPNQIVI